MISGDTVDEVDSRTKSFTPPVVCVAELLKTDANVMVILSYPLMMGSVENLGNTVSIFETTDSVPAVVGWSVYPAASSKDWT